MSDVIHDLEEWATQEEIGVTEAGHHILSRAAAEILRLRAELADAKRKWWIAGRNAARKAAANAPHPNDPDADPLMAVARHALWVDNVISNMEPPA